MKSCFAALDCGTTWIKAGILDAGGRILGLGTKRSPARQGQEGRVEVDPRGLLTACKAALREAVRAAGAGAATVAALAMTNQRATVFFLDARGTPVGNGISWQDMRGAAAVAAFGKRVSGPEFFALTGLPLDPVFTLGKVLMVRSLEPERFERIARLALVQDLVLRDLGADGFYCDLSNASLTGLLDVAELDWNERLLGEAGLRRGQLPELVAPGRQIGHLSGEAARQTGLPEGLPLVSGGGDQQCAGLGAGAVEPGLVEITIGTAAAPLCAVERPLRDPLRRVPCCVHAVPELWELEGLQSSAGACLEWLAGVANRGRRFNQEFFERVSLVPPGAHGVVFLPYLAGCSAPRWLPRASGVLMGLQLRHGLPEIGRAVLEGVSFQTREILDGFASLGVNVTEVRLTGGCTSIEVWNQLQASLYGAPVTTLENPQATLVGATLLAAAGVKAFESISHAAREMVRVRACYQPDPEQAEVYDRLHRERLALHSRLIRGRVFGGTAVRRKRGE